MVLEIIDGEDSLGRTGSIHWGLDVWAGLRLHGGRVAIGLRIVVLSLHGFLSVFLNVFLGEPLGQFLGRLLGQLVRQFLGKWRFVAAGIGERRVLEGTVE